MNTYVVKVVPYPIVQQGNTYIVNTDKSLDETLELMQEQFTLENPYFEYDFYAWESVKDYINSLTVYDVD